MNVVHVACVCVARAVGVARVCCSLLVLPHAAGSNCSVARVASSLCFAVDLDEAAGVVAPHGLTSHGLAAAGGFGCRFAEGRWHALTHRTVPSSRTLPDSAMPPSAKSLDSAMLRLTVRSALDPHLAAANLTAGTMRLDAAPEERLGNAVGLLVLASCLALPPVLAVAAAWNRGGRRREQQSDDERFEGRRSSDECFSAAATSAPTRDDGTVGGHGGEALRPRAARL